MAPNFQQSIKSDANLQITFLAILWLAVHIFFLTNRGIVLEFEAGKYIDQAHQFIDTGTLSAKNLWFYSLQIFILSLAIKLKIGFIPVYLFQLLLNGLSTICFFLLCKKKANYISAYIATALLILNLPMQEFTCYLQTESIFISLTIFYTYYIDSIRKIDTKALVITFFFLAVLCFTRPNGLILIASTSIFFYFRFLRSIPLRKYIFPLLSCLAIFFLVVNIALGSGGEWRFMLAFQKELVLCADTPYFTTIKMSNNPNSLQGFLYYIFNNWSQFIRLAFLKLVAFVGLYRSYFSPSHNFYLIAYIYPIYICIIFGLKSWIKKDLSFMLFLVCIILLALITVILTCDDVHNRFFLILCPYFYILSLPTIQKLFTKERFY